MPPPFPPRRSSGLSKRSSVTRAIALPCVEWLHSTVSTDAHDAVANLFDLGCSGFAPQFIGGFAAIVVIDSLGIGVLPELHQVQVHRLSAGLLNQENLVRVAGRERVGRSDWIAGVAVQLKK